FYRNVKRTRQVAERKFVFGPDIQYDDSARLKAADQLLARDRFEPIEPVEIIRNDLPDLRTIAFRIAAKRCEQRQNWPIREPIEDALTVPPRLHKPATPQLLKVLGRVGKRQFCELSQALHRALALRDMLDQFEPVRVTQDTRQLCKMYNNLIFCVSN